MKFIPNPRLLALWLALALVSGPALLRAQEPPPAAPAAPVAEPPRADEKKPDDAAVKQPEPAVVTGTENTPPVVEPAPAKPAETPEKDDDDDEGKSASAEKKLHRLDGGNREEDEWSYNAPRGSQVRVLDDNHVAADVTVKGDAVAVLGDLTVDGEVKHDAVAIMGDNVINGTVRRNAVVIMGDITLGPKARVDGNVVCVGGEIHRDPGAVVGGRTEIKSVEEKFHPLNSWWLHGLRLGRPLAIGAHLGWLWIVTGVTIAFYALLALLFPDNIRKCGEKLVERPGMTVLAAVLSLLALPVLFVLLCITIIGIPVALLLLPLGVLLGVLFGKAAIYALVGRKVSQDRLHPVFAVMVGAGLFVLLYLVPVLGLLLSLLVSLVGFGCVLLTVFTPAHKVASVAVAPVPPVVPEPGDPAGLPPAVAPLPAAVFLPPVISAATLPRAGFWIRVAAVLLDTILLGIFIGVSEGFFHGFGFHPGDGFPFWVAAYSVVMWATKGTTIGGIICGLKVVRLDDRPVDWSVALVRGLSAFLSLAVAGLGFIWVAFDDEKQSWHDKIAGTTIVKVPKGTALL